MEESSILENYLLMTEYLVVMVRALAKWIHPTFIILNRVYIMIEYKALESPFYLNSPLLVTSANLMSMFRRGIRTLSKRAQPLSALEKPNLGPTSPLVIPAIRS